ncbi:hypothetical protein ACFLS1_07565 [Verrucomicrobiota bacterium]
MTAELQNLLERIQKDGVEKAETATEKTISEAKAKAKSILAEAEEKAGKLLEKAEEDAKAFEERARKSLKQAARDVILSIGTALNNTMKDIVKSKSAEALKSETLEKIIAETVAAYCSETSKDKRIEILLPADQQKRITDFFLSQYAAQLEKGIEIKADSSIAAGFKVSVVDENVEHDFSDEAISEALCQLLSPRLTEIVKKQID